MKSLGARSPTRPCGGSATTGRCRPAACSERRSKERSPGGVSRRLPRGLPDARAVLHGHRAVVVLDALGRRVFTIDPDLEREVGIRGDAAGGDRDPLALAGQERTGLFASDHYPRYDTYVSGMSYANWLRLYWETRGAGV